MAEDDPKKDDKAEKKPEKPPLNPLLDKDGKPIKPDVFRVTKEKKDKE